MECLYSSFGMSVGCLLDKSGPAVFTLANQCDIFINLLPINFLKNELCKCLIYREVEDELEIVWQAANSENDRMKTVLHKTMKKIRQHEQLAEAIDQQEPKKIVYISSDGEGD
jgi:hypothetical protein